ncbi:glycoside hydrolase [Acidobacteria bacterium AH-259-O06]|nr:glycoside hydrolase [Acidobacteria bacterium AH-259-O06]
MPGLISRRRMLSRSCAAATGLVFTMNRRAHAAPRATIETTTVISQQPSLYHGWPTVARRRSGELLVVCSGGREAHVCPFGRVELMRSKDEGRTWSFPRVLIDGPIDDRDTGVVETSRGSLLVTTFTSVAYESRLKEATEMKPGTEKAWPEEKLRRWQAAHRRLDPAQREIELGSWMIRSTDGGQSWSARYRCPVNSPHGPIQLSDGRLLYAGKMFWYGRSGQRAGQIGVCESTDDGQSWRWLADIPTRPGDSLDNYHELHAVEAADHSIVAQIRNHNKVNERETLQSESHDAGRTWSTPHPIGVWGFPSHLLRLRDGRLLMSYGHRRQPLGNQARLSKDHGRTWSNAMIISGDGTSSDLGYPSTVELADGSLLTVWYELRGSPRGDLAHYDTRGRDEAWYNMTDNLPRAVLRQARWSIQS